MHVETGCVNSALVIDFDGQLLMVSTLLLYKKEIA